MWQMSEPVFFLFLIQVCTKSWKLLQHIHFLQVQSQNKRVNFSIQLGYKRRGRVERIKERRREEEEEERRRETAGSLPCPLTVTFLVNSSYDFLPPPLFSLRWEEDRESWEGFKHLNSSCFISVSLFFITRKPGVADPHKHEQHPDPTLLLRKTVFVKTRLKKGFQRTGFSAD